MSLMKWLLPDWHEETKQREAALRRAEIDQAVSMARMVDSDERDSRMAERLIRLADEAVEIAREFKKAPADEDYVA